jgi:hypothetical protein
MPIIAATLIIALAAFSTASSGSAQQAAKRSLCLSGGNCRFVVTEDLVLSSSLCRCADWEYGYHACGWACGDLAVHHSCGGASRRRLRASPPKFHDAGPRGLCGRRSVGVQPSGVLCASVASSAVSWPTATKAETRGAASTAEWLRGHPEVEVVSRHRAGLYADGACQGRPPGPERRGRA